MEKILVGNRCSVCGKMNKVEVYKADFEAWQNGELIQKAMPYLSANEREIIQTGTCAKCWDKLFGEPEEEEEPDYEYEFAYEDEDLDCDCEFVPEDEDDIMLIELGDMTDEDFEAFANFLCG